MIIKKSCVCVGGSLKECNSGVAQYSSKESNFMELHHYIELFVTLWCKCVYMRVVCVVCVSL